jgi:Tat protein secretion system quality control protein TatD with DNase activity
MVRHVAERVAELRGETLEQVCIQTSANAALLFSLPYQAFV